MAAMLRPSSVTRLIERSNSGRRPWLSHLGLFVALFGGLSSYTQFQDGLANPLEEAAVDVSVHLAVLGLILWRSVQAREVWLRRPVLPPVRLAFLVAPALLLVSCATWALWQNAVSATIPALGEWLAQSGQELRVWLVDGFWPIAESLNLVTALVLAPVVEELVFRGLFLSSLRKRFSDWTAVATTSIVFGIVHVHDPLGGVVFGWVCAVLAIKRGNLLWPIAVHSGFNALVALLEFTELQLGFDPSQWPTPSLVLTAIAAGLLGSTMLRWLWRRIGSMSSPE